MVNQKILVRDKWRKTRKIIFALIIITLIIGILLVVFFTGLFSSKKKVQVIIENPLKDIIFANTNEKGEVNKKEVINQGVLEFDEKYINYILAALGVNNLHKSSLGYGNPVVEFVLENEVWSSKLDNGLITKKIPDNNKDLIITMSKEEAIKAILSSDIHKFMKKSVVEGRTKIEIVSGKIELGSKGYLKMYSELTGKEINKENL